MANLSATHRATLLLLLVAPCAAADRVSYSEDIAPILERCCAGCHTRDYAEGGVALDSYDALMAGGKSGLAVTPGSGSSSRLLLMVKGELEPVMPPKGESAPTLEEIELIAKWIDDGAYGASGPPPLKRKPVVPTIRSSTHSPPPATAVCYSPRGDLLAVAGYGKVELRREDGSAAATLTQGVEKVNALRFNHDGSKLLVASGTPGAYGAALLFSTETLELVREFVGLRDTLYAAAFSPDESLIAAAGYDHKIVVWDAASGEVVQQLEGHNGAVFDLEFSPDGAVLVSASADETLKVWNPRTGERLDTLSQPEGEVNAVEVTPDGRHVVAVSADNRLRAWRLQSIHEPAINPLVATLFVDESPLIDLRAARNGTRYVVLSRAGALKVVLAETWSQEAALEPLEHPGLDLGVHPDGDRLCVATTSGAVERRELPKLAERVGEGFDAVEPIYMDLGRLTQLNEEGLREGTDPAAVTDLPIPRGALVLGSLSSDGQRDHYRWTARAGEQWAIDLDAVETSQLDPMVSVLDADHTPLVRVRLQATLDSYYAFRGKNSTQTGDYRVFNREDMELNQYFYSAGEVVRLWMHPRGPDSGFLVYPGEGQSQRWTYFGTTGVTHALGEPAYIVRPLAPGEPRDDNGLPVFEVEYKNDDDPRRLAGKNSRLLFTAPEDGEYVLRVEDARGFGGDGYAYRLTVRAATPSFEAHVSEIGKPLLPGAGREFLMSVDRIDGFDGSVTFDVDTLPEGIRTNLPVSVEPGQKAAIGLFWLDQAHGPWDGAVEPSLTAVADIHGRRVERRAGTLGQLTVGESPSVIPSLTLASDAPPGSGGGALRVRRGETAYARVVLARTEGDDQEVRFGKEFAARNAPHGVYVDHIGLSGLLVRQGENEREFAITADRNATLGERAFFLTGQVRTKSGVEKVSTNAIVVEVLP